MTALTSETQYILQWSSSTQGGDGKPFVTAEFTNEHEGKLLFHKLGFRDYRRDAPADSFRKMMNPEEKFEFTTENSFCEFGFFLPKKCHTVGKKVRHVGFQVHQKSSKSARIGSGEKNRVWRKKSGVSSSSNIGQ